MAWAGRETLPCRHFARVKGIVVVLPEFCIIYYCRIQWAIEVEQCTNLPFRKFRLRCLLRAKDHWMSGSEPRPKAQGPGTRERRMREEERSHARTWTAGGPSRATHASAHTWGRGCGRRSRRRLGGLHPRSGLCARELTCDVATADGRHGALLAFLYRKVGSYHQLYSIERSQVTAMYHFWRLPPRQGSRGATRRGWYGQKKRRPGPWRAGECVWFAFPCSPAWFLGCKNPSLSWLWPNAPALRFSRARSWPSRRELPLESSHLPHPLLVSRSGAMAELPCAHVGARARDGGAPPLPRSRSSSESGVASLCFLLVMPGDSDKAPAGTPRGAALPGRRRRGASLRSWRSWAREVPAALCCARDEALLGRRRRRGASLHAWRPWAREAHAALYCARDADAALPGRRPRLRMCLIASLGPVYVLACVDCFAAAA
jgi:hypothetical protein